jgi:hypothetical protein
VLAEGEMWRFREMFRSCDGRGVDGSDRILSGDLRDHISLAGDESTRRVWHWDHKLDLNFFLGINKSGPCFKYVHKFSRLILPISLPSKVLLRNEDRSYYSPHISTYRR